MRALKGAVLLIACLAVVLSMAPVVAHALTAENQYGPGANGSSGASWKVTCTYDAQDHFLGKTCTSGGTDTCACP